jgi:hypothetical protein
MHPQSTRMLTLQGFGGFGFRQLDPMCVAVLLNHLVVDDSFPVMLYANTLMTVATICHVRKSRMWLRPTSELPRFAAPTLTFAPKSDTVFDSSFINKTNESEIPILGRSGQSVDPRNPSHFRSRLAFFPPPTARTGLPPADPSPSHPSDSVTSLAPSVSSQLEVTQNVPDLSRPSTGHPSDSIGEPPTYSGPGSNY